MPMIASREEIDFSFGVIGDLQFFDGDDGSQYGDPNRVRRYRAALVKFEEAVRFFRNCSIMNSPPLHLCILLGDTIDGKCEQDGTSNAAFARVTDVLSRQNLNGPKWHFLVGNHDLYNFTRDQLYEKEQYVPLSVRSECSPQKLYYSIQPHPRYLFVFLDPFEISTCGGVSQAAKDEAQQLLIQKNPNLSNGGSWLNGLDAATQRYVPYNGACSMNQLVWLELELSKSRVQGQKVFVFCHCPLYMPCCRPSGLAWNADDILILLQRSGNVVACFYGHDHDGGYACDSTGIHHILPPAVLEAGEEHQAYGVVSVSRDGLHLQWTGQPPPSTYDWPQHMLFPK
jgi:manganese-dependent ADP-ribose/CDP-alcohol diphosphatase